MESAVATRRRLITATASGLVAARLPRPGLAQEATPTTGDVDDGSLPSMLARAADPTASGGAGQSTMFTYANIARQLEVRGMRTPDSGFHDKDRFSEWADGVDGLYVDRTVLERALLEELWESVGFSPAEIAQSMTVGDVPRITRIYRGDFNGTQIRRALEGSGYEEIETEQGPVLSIGAEGEFELTHPVQSIILNAYNNVAVIDDTHIVAGAYLADVVATLGAFAGGGISVARNRAVETLLTAVEEELVSATVIGGEVLSVAGMPELTGEGAVTPTSMGTISSASHVLFGLTPGSMPSRYVDEDAPLQGDNDDTAPRSAFVIALHLGSAEAAEAAAPVIEARFAEGISVRNGQPYTELLGEAEVLATPDSPVVKLRITGERIGRIWLQVVFGRDLAFVFTE